MIAPAAAMHALSVAEIDARARSGDGPEWLESCLTAEERLHWTALRVPKRRREWLGGRIAAKTAVAARHGLAGPGHLRTVEIRTRCEGPERGRPLYILDGRSGEYDLSITHSAGIAVAALASSPGERIGIDCELVEPRDASFEAIAFSRGEIEVLNGFTPDERLRAVTGAWCLKEALLKAIGIGLRAPLPEVELRATLLRELGRTDRWAAGARDLFTLGPALARLHPMISCMHAWQLTARLWEVAERVLCARVTIGSGARDWMER